MADRNDRRDSYRSLVFLISGVVLLYAAYWGAVIVGLSNWAERGQFGDLFGGVNALFTALAFAGLIYTVVLQRRELALQREELRQTREELAGQKEQLAQQNQTLRLQSFENTFFQLLGLHHQIVDAMTIQTPDYGGRTKIVKGRDTFAEVYSELQQRSHTRLKREPQNVNGWSEVGEVYRDTYETHQAMLGHYFRNLYHIIKLVDGSSLEHKRRYTSLARAQLSSFELVCLFYNCLSQEGVEKFKPLIERYTLLKNLSFDLLLDERHAALYEKSAFFSVTAS